MEYFYKVNITNGKSLHLKEMSLEDYKNLQKICIETDFDNFSTYINELVEELCVDNIDFELNLLDIFILVLSIRCYSISDEKVFYTHVNGQKATKSINLESIIESILNVYDDAKDMGCEYPIDDFIADTVILNPLTPNPIVGFKREGKIVMSNPDKDFVDLIPYEVQKQIDNHISNAYTTYNQILLFTLHNEGGKENKIYFELNEKFIYEFLRIILRDDLKTLYKNLYDVKRNLNIGFDEHKFITFSELEMYIAMFNKEQEDAKQNEPEGKTVGMPQVHM